MSRKTSPVRHTPGHGRSQARSVGGGVNSTSVAEVLRDFHTLNTKEARSAFADTWVRITSRSLESTWPAFYQLLSLIRDDRLYADPQFMANGDTFESFEDYWSKIVRKPFAVWGELERTYQFAHRCDPELFNATYSEATKAVADRAENAKPAPTHEDHPGGRGKKELRSEEVSYGETADYLTARIARDHPDILERMKAGEYTSVRRAALDAGIVKPRLSIPADPTGASRAILKRFQGDDLATLLRELANHAGFDLVPRTND